MVGKKFQIFISSTYEDLKEQRDAVVKAILQMGHLPVGMEMFNAGDETQWETIKRHIDTSDYYIVILAHRYGSKEKSTGISYTEKEFIYAGEQGIPRLGFVIEKGAAWPNTFVESGPAKKKLDAFKNKVGEARVIKFWDNTDKLSFQVFASLSNEINVNPRIGWIRASEASSPLVAEQLADLVKENKDLKMQLDKFKNKSSSDPLDKIINETVVKSKNSDDISLSLKDIFFVIALRQPITLGDIIHKMFPDSSYSENYKKQVAEVVHEILLELQRLGAISNRIELPEPPLNVYPQLARTVWELTGRGNTLYTSLRYNR